MNQSSKDDVDFAGSEDEVLVRKAREALEGDLRPFEQLVLRYERRMVANCRYITHDPNEAEDLAQEVMVKAFYGLRSFEGRSTFRHWLQRIKVNHCLNHLKKQEGRSYIGVDEPEAGGFDQLRVQATAEHQAEVIGERELIARILNSMTETLRIPLVLCDMDELSYEEVAKVLGVSLSAVKMRIKRAREDFRSRYLNMQTIVMEAGRR